MDFRDTARGYDGNQWTLGKATDVTIEQLLTWDVPTNCSSEGDPVNGVDQ